MNDEHDNALADKAILRRVEKHFTAERARRLSADPRKRLADTICSACQGSGLDSEDTKFVWDDFNPEGYWEQEPCRTCGGTGLSEKVNDTIVCGELDKMSLQDARRAFNQAVDGLRRAKDVLATMPEAKDNPRKVDAVVGCLTDDLTELLRQLDPEG